MDPAWIVDGPTDAARTFAFAHGAGAPMDTPFMQTVARGMAARGIRVVRFEFPYMASRRGSGKKRGPDRAPVLESTWINLVTTLGDPAHLYIGGKSMGGRIATMVADRLGVAGVVCFGYPFHPAGKPQSLRIAHLEAMTTPCLIVQGTRDALGSRVEVAGYALSPQVCLEWLEDGDHSLKPRVKSGFREEGHLQRAVELASGFVQS